MSVLILESLAEAFAKKDAEIERLKAVDAIKETAIRDLCAIARDKNQLITELADALEEQDPGYDRYKTLIKNAREATHGT